MTTIQRQSLSIDLDALFPGESVEIGGQSILIRPLNIEQIAILSKKLSGIGAILSKLGVTWENYNEHSNIFKLAVTVIENFANVLEEAANVKSEDLKKLPIEAIVKILDKILEVNLKSKEELEKNFKSLTGKFLPNKPAQKAKKTNRK